MIFFGKKDGWENAPFLFARTDAGWQFDIVHQRKYIRMGRNPKWGIERADYPYIDLLSRCPYFMGQDIPLEDADRYWIEDDGDIARRIVELENQYSSDPDDGIAAMELGRRRAGMQHIEKVPVKSSEIVYKLFHPLIGDLEHEEFWLLMLNRANRVASLSASACSAWRNNSRCRSMSTAAWACRPKHNRQSIHRV